MWFDAARNGDLVEIEKGLTLAKKADAESTEYGRTALWLASAGGHASVVTRLIEANARLDCHDSGMEGDTPLHIAAFKGHAEVVQLLITAGASPQVTNANGRTAGDLVARNSDVSAKTNEAVRAILEGGGEHGKLHGAPAAGGPPVARHAEGDSTQHNSSPRPSSPNKSNVSAIERARSSNIARARSTSYPSKAEGDKKPAAQQLQERAGLEPDRGESGGARVTTRTGVIISSNLYIKKTGLSNKWYDNKW